MEINYQIIYQDHVVKSHIPALSIKVKSLIKKAIEERLMLAIVFGKPYTIKGHRRLKVSDYRVIYRIENKFVIIIAIKHRRDIVKVLV